MAAENRLRLIDPAWDWQQARQNFRWSIPDNFNIAEVCCDRWARADPQRLALVHLAEDGTTTRYTFAQLKTASDQFANVLRAYGVTQGDRVGMLLPQGPAVLIAHLATYKIGAIALPLFTLFGPDALSYRLQDSGAKVLITDGENLDKAEAVKTADAGALQTIFSVDAGAGLSFWEELSRASRHFVPVQTKAEDPAVLIYTSGTTGPPKGALHAHRFLLGHLPSMEVGHGGFPAGSEMGWTPADWAWIGGLMDMAMPCLYYGVPQLSHRMRKFDPDYAYSLMTEHALTRLFMPPTALRMLQTAKTPSGLRVKSVTSGGESLGEALHDWGTRRLGAPINEVYGQTECNLVISANPDLMTVKPDTMGYAVPGHEVAIIDSKGAEVPADTLGEIAIRAPDPVMFLGYWNNPAATEKKFVNGWLCTGDLGRKDAEGYFRFESRSDDVITSAGYRIGPTEIENCLSAHPDVVMAAAIGVPDPVRTEVVKAFVVLRDGAIWDGLESQLIARVRDRVSPHVAPRMIQPLETMPVTATGKILRRSLRDL